MSGNPIPDAAIVCRIYLPQPANIVSAILRAGNHRLFTELEDGGKVMVVYDPAKMKKGDR